MISDSQLLALFVHIGNCIEQKLAPSENRIPKEFNLSQLDNKEKEEMLDFARVVESAFSDVGFISTDQQKLNEIVEKYNIIDGE